MRSNVRELEGAINKLIAEAGLAGRQVTLAFAQRACATCCAPSNRRSASQHPEGRQTTTACNARICCRKRRTRSLARPRQAGDGAVQELTEHSLPEIGDALVGRDHTTVLHACRQVRHLMETDGKLHEDWES